MKPYNPKDIETKWQSIWADTKLYQTGTDSDKPYYYNLTMFPYPSGDLHTGHWYAFAAPDVLARFQRMQGKNVLFPMGWDAFGLPAENAAIKRNIAPAAWTELNIASMKQQLLRMGASFDWEKEISTADPDYYKWTQKLFLILHENGLAYQDQGLQNWCPSCQTVLANEQVVGDDQVCERCETPVVKKQLKQWFFKITDYAEPLIADLDKLDWPEKVKTMQRNWIGKSTGALVRFTIPELDASLEVFTTRAETLFGATFMVIAPEHPLLSQLTTPENQTAVEKYLDSIKHQTDIERQSTEREKTGVFTGSYATNPVNGKLVPIWVADYVLISYGSGAIMAVPAHDDRDLAFATKFNLDIIPVIESQSDEDNPAKAHSEKMINSSIYDGKYPKDVAPMIIKALEKDGLGEISTQYRLRDWLISRQRYWGAPIPIIYCDECGVVPVPESDLPVRLPEDVAFAPTGQSPLVERADFVNTTCPKCAKPAKREVDTMDTFVDSSWYFLRYPNTTHTDIFDPDAIKKWLPVDHYLGGVEHAILHLLYSRFITKALADFAGLKFDEPFKRLTTQGLILGPDGQKMSKSRGNVVNPDEIIDSGYGADAFRTYLLFVGPWTDGSPFTTKGLAGTYRFLNRTWVLTHEFHHALKYDSAKAATVDNQSELETQLEIAVQRTTAKVTRDIENLSFNTAIAAMMELVNLMYKLKTQLDYRSSEEQWRVSIETLLILLSPYAPHLCEELWALLGHTTSIHIENWPIPDESVAEPDVITMVIQINGKVRGTILLAAGLDQEETTAQVNADSAVKKILAGRKVTRTIVVPGRLVNFVLSSE